MKETTIFNPFVIGKYVSDRYFCDREAETEFVLKQLRNGRNIALISPRRMGKSGLIRHCFEQNELKDNAYTFFIDIYATRSLSEFVYLLGKEIFEVLKPKKTEWKECFFQIISSLRVGFKLDQSTGEPTFSLGIGEIQAPQTTLDEIFKYLEEADLHCVVAIGEFQQIGEYEQKNVEALLRTRIQQCQNTSFIFSGSSRHLMTNMFSSSSKPFYQSAISMGLEPIPERTYVDFACRLFDERGKAVEPELVRKVYNTFGGCTWFVQMLMNELFAMTEIGKTCGLEMFNDAIDNVIQAQEQSYQYMLSNVAPKQRLILQAIAQEGEAVGITSASFIRKHALSSASSVQSAVKMLVKNDIITQEDGKYRVYDYFFAEWLRRY